MKHNKITIGMTASLLCLVFLGAFLAQGYKQESLGSRCAIEENSISSYSQRDPDINNGSIAKLFSEASIEELENAYYYQMIEDNYIDGQVKITNSTKTRSCDEPCIQMSTCLSCDC